MGSRLMTLSTVRRDIKKEVTMSKLYETVTIISGELSELIRLACLGRFSKAPTR